MGAITIFSALPVIILCSMMIYGIIHGTDVFGALTEGASNGLRVIYRIVPSLVIMITVVTLFRASGLMEALISVLKPLFDLIGVPPETMPLMIIRPFSGSGACAAAGEIIKENGADSLIGRTAAVMLGSTETTFYTISVYFGAAKLQKTKWAVPAALIADITGFIMASVTVRLIWG